MEKEECLRAIKTAKNEGELVAAYRTMREWRGAPEPKANLLNIYDFSSVPAFEHEEDKEWAWALGDKIAELGLDQRVEELKNERKRFTKEIEFLEWVEMQGGDISKYMK